MYEKPKLEVTTHEVLKSVWLLEKNVGKGQMKFKGREPISVSQSAYATAKSPVGMLAKGL